MVRYDGIEGVELVYAQERAPRNLRVEASLMHHLPSLAVLLEVYSQHAVPVWSQALIVLEGVLVQALQIARNLFHLLLCLHSQHFGVKYGRKRLEYNPRAVYVGLRQLIDEVILNLH